MQEELGELTLWILDFENDRVARDIELLGEDCRFSFSLTTTWQKTPTAIGAKAKNDPDLLRQEIADMQVVLFNMATAIEEITGKPFDVVQTAVDKSRSDVKRGVR
jgi:hypothetical protein